MGLFIEGIEEVEVEEVEEEICIPGVGWVSIWTEEAREYLHNRDEGAIEPGFDSEGAIDAFLAANPDNLEVIPEGAKHYNITDQEWSAAVEVGDLDHLFEGGI